MSSVVSVPSFLWLLSTSFQDEGQLLFYDATSRPCPHSLNFMDLQTWPFLEIFLKVCDLETEWLLCPFVSFHILANLS